MAVTIATANAYFLPAKHIFSAVWNGFQEPQKTAALYQANQVLTRVLGYEPNDDASAITDQPRQDLAVCEQALYMLRNSPLIADGSQPAPHWDGGAPRDPFEAREGADPYALAPEAQRWLQWSSGNQRTGARLTIARG